MSCASNSPSGSSVLKASATLQNCTQVLSSAQSDVEPSSRKSRKRLNRVLASCSNCRRRRTRCDRILPCSECTKRDVTCDYEGASLPTIAARRNLNTQVELQEEIQRLQAKLEHLQQQVIQKNPSPSPPANEIKQDFTTDDLATALSNFTLSRSAQYAEAHSLGQSLRDRFDSVLSDRSQQRPQAFFCEDEAFTLSLIPATPSPSLESLINNHLPTRTEFNLLSMLYFKSMNVWTTAMNYHDWNVQINAFWQSTDRLNFRPVPIGSETLSSTVYQLAHFVSCLFCIAAQGLLQLNEIHCMPATQAECLDANISYIVRYNPEFRQLNRKQKVTLANTWFRYALGLLLSEESQIYVKPTMYGIRAFSALGYAKVPPDQFDSSIFFWEMTTKLAELSGLFQEPPVSEHENLELLDDVELESRRHLAWSILCLYWTGIKIRGGVPYCCDPSRYVVKMPGTVDIPVNKLDPGDGWPIDAFVIARRALAMNGLATHMIDLKIFPGNLVTYDEVLKLENQLKAVETSLPDRFQVVMSPDRTTVELKIPADPRTETMVMYTFSRLAISMVKLHRLFITPKPGVPPEERQRHLKELSFQSRRHFLLSERVPGGMNTHPLVLFGLITSATARALAFLEAPDVLEREDELAFFMPEFEKLLRIFHRAETSLASTMARKAVGILTALVKRIKHSTTTSPGMMSPDRNKKGPGVSSQAFEDEIQADDDLEFDQLKRKREISTTPVSTQSVSSNMVPEIDLMPHNPQAVGSQIDLGTQSHDLNEASFIEVLAGLTPNFAFEMYSPASSGACGPGAIPSSIQWPKFSPPEPRSSTYELPNFAPDLKTPGIGVQPSCAELGHSLICPQSQDSSQIASASPSKMSENESNPSIFDHQLIGSSDQPRFLFDSIPWDEHSSSQISLSLPENILGPWIDPRPMIGLPTRAAPQVSKSTKFEIESFRTDCQFDFGFTEDLSSFISKSDSTSPTNVLLTRSNNLNVGNHQTLDKFVDRSHTTITSWTGEAIPW